MMCTEIEKCDYYISGALYVEKVEKSYAQCVSVCPDEFPVHDK